MGTLSAQSYLSCGLFYMDSIPAASAVTQVHLFKMAHLPVNCERSSSIPHNNALTYRNSTVIAHRLSIYVPNIFLQSKNPQKLILDINTHVALFRDTLIHVGQTKDNPELREKIRKYRHICMEECKSAVHFMITLLKSAPYDCDTSHLVLLFYLLQLFSKELMKSYRLIQIIPMDMSKHYDNRTRPTNLGNVIGQILLCKQITPDFKAEELCSIAKDIHVIDSLMADMQLYLPPQLETLYRPNSTPCLLRNDSVFSGSSALLCCISRPKYM